MADTTDEFADLYAATFAPLCALLFVHTGDLDEAHDLTQRAFTRTLAHWSRVHREDPVSFVRAQAWQLATGGRRTATSTESRHRRQPDVGEDGARWQARLAALTPPQRRALILHHLADGPAVDLPNAFAEPVELASGSAGVAAGLTALRDAALLLIQPPGVPASRPATRRWVMGGAGVAAAAAVVVTVVAMTTPWQDPAQQPALRAEGDDVVVVTAATTDGDAAIEAMTDGDATIEATTDGVGEASPTTPDLGAAGTTDRSGQGTGSQPQPSQEELLAACLRNIRITSFYNAGWVTVEWGDHETCPPEAKGRVFWASYALQPDGTGVLYASQERLLDDNNRVWNFHIDIPEGCETWFVVVGPVGIKQTLTAAQMQDNDLAYAGTGPWVGGPTDAMNYSDYGCTPPPPEEPSDP